MNSMKQAVATAVANPQPAKKSSRKSERERHADVIGGAPPIRKQAAPVAAPAVTAAPKPEIIFTIADREKLRASKYGLRLTAYAADQTLHRDHTTVTLAAILSLKGDNFTLTDVIANLDRLGFEGKKPKSDKLLRAYVSDCVQTLENFGISRQ